MPETLTPETLWHEFECAYGLDDEDRIALMRIYEIVKKMRSAWEAERVHYKAANEHIGTLAAELVKARKRIEALERYTQHLPECWKNQALRDLGVGGKLASCTCGLDDYKVNRGIGCMGDRLPE